MRWFLTIFIGLSLLAAAPNLRAVDPIPESQQAVLALKVLNAYHGTQTTTAAKKLHVVYFTPSNRDPEPHYRERLEAILEDIRAFYRDGMERAGFGPKTFDMDRDTEGKWILHLVKGREPETNYAKLDSNKIDRECVPVLEAAGIAPKQETVLIICNLASWDEKAGTFRNDHSPYYGGWSQTNGWCYTLDTVILDVNDIPKKEPTIKDHQWGDESLGKFNTIFIGGIAHELGHAFSLPHCGERWDEKTLGTSIMGDGNHTYRAERRHEGPGAFLTMASAMKLASRPLFSKSNKDDGLLPHLEKSEFHLSTKLSRKDLAGRSGTLRVEGTVRGTPPVYGIIAYFDSIHDDGYLTPAATAVPDAKGRFAIEISDLTPCKNGQLRIQYCHVNGAVSVRQASFSIPRSTNP